jgi:diadenosine tetraphosphate (Ap4A) HIT family hydrolase
MPSNFEELQYFIQKKMRPSHVYQPVMLMSLLRNNGQADVTDIAKDFLAQDQSQIEYYEQVAKRWPTTTLVKHGLIEKNKKQYKLSGFDDLTESEVCQLIEDCETKLAEFLQKQAATVFNHRRKSSGVISGSVRYQVLTQAKGRCELCGIPAEQKALDVDHIVPRNKGGSDDISNLQALCYSCNRMKRDSDDTDFRAVREEMYARQSGCLFCEIPEKRIIAENELAYAIRDGFPVTELHTLIIPKRHVASYFDLSRPEINAVNELLRSLRYEIQSLDSNVTGFNIGTNDGESSGQTIFHCHVHLIPRRVGDTDNPQGGVRGVIPSKQRY